MSAPVIRRYTNLPGSPPSVTSILSAAWPKPALQQWFISETAKLAREYPSTPVDQLLRKHGPKGAERGTSVHQLIAGYLGGFGDPPYGLVEQTEAEQMYAQWYDWWQEAGELDLSIVAPEQPVVSHPDHDGIHYAGTADAVAHRHLWDWKTASNLPDEPYADHVAQVAAYAACLTGGCLRVKASVVYIGLKGVRPFDIPGDKLLAAYDAFHACYRLAEYLYPDQMKDVAP